MLICKMGEQSYRLWGQLSRVNEFGFCKVLRIAPVGRVPSSTLTHVFLGCLESNSGFPCFYLAGCSEPWCFNGGTCRQALYSSDFVCQCPEGFMGKLCEIGEWRAGVYEMRTYQGKSHLQNDAERRAKCGVMTEGLEWGGIP